MHQSRWDKFVTNGLNKLNVVYFLLVFLILMVTINNNRIVETINYNIDGINQPLDIGEGIVKVSLVRVENLNNSNLDYVTIDLRDSIDKDKTYSFRVLKENISYDNLKDIIEIDNTTYADLRELVGGGKFK